MGTSGQRMTWMGTSTLERAAAEAPPSTLPVAEAQAAILRPMVAHHSGGVAMAQAGADLAEDPCVIRPTENIARSRTAELEDLQSLLPARGLPLAEVVQAAPHEVVDGHDGDSPDGRDPVLLSLMPAGVAAGALAPAAAALAVSAVHLVRTPQHAGESAVDGVLFSGTFSGTAVLAAAGAAARAAAGVGAVLIALYVLFRFALPPLGAAAPERLGVWGMVAVAAEVITLTSAAALLRTPRDRRGLPVA